MLFLRLFLYEILFVLCLGRFADDAIVFGGIALGFVRLLTSMILNVNLCGLVCCFKCYWLSLAKF